MGDIELEAVERGIAVPELRPPFYPHRWNRDGTYDSICLKCFATVANVRDAGELDAYDDAHICEESYLAERGMLK